MRRLLFWSHLLAGCIAGAIILVMSVTGVILTYERQILARVERGGFRAAPPTAGARHLPVEELLAKVDEQRGGIPPNASLTLRSDPMEPAEVSAGRDSLFYVQPYTGKVLGQPSRTGWRDFFQRVTAWHRWLGATGDGRTTAKAITGACNISFLVLIVTGPFLWWPKQWSRRHLASISWFRRNRSGKARDFNWHNVFGIWSTIPLFFVALTAVPMSYEWGNHLIYRLTGTQAPASRGGQAPEGQGRAARTVDLAGINQLWDRAESQIPGWRSIALRLPQNPRQPASFTIDSGDGGQPQKRATLTLDRTDGPARLETFHMMNAGRRVRSWSRFIHTGEAFGMAGQTIAGLASAGGVMLVWTGIALSLRRFSAWRRRRNRVAEAELVESP